MPCTGGTDQSNFWEYVSHRDFRAQTPYNSTVEPFVVIQLDDLDPVQTWAYNSNQAVPQEESQPSTETTHQKPYDHATFVLTSNIDVDFFWPRFGASDRTPHTTRRTISYIGFLVTTSYLPRPNSHQHHESYDLVFMKKHIRRSIEGLRFSSYTFSRRPPGIEGLPMYTDALLNWLKDDRLRQGEVNRLMNGNGEMLSSRTAIKKLDERLHWTEALGLMTASGYCACCR